MTEGVIIPAEFVSIVRKALELQLNSAMMGGAAEDALKALNESERNDTL